MPHEYEVMVGKFAEEFRNAGYSDEEALKKAKSKAAAIYNSRHPHDPVGRNYDKEHKRS